MTAPPTHAWFVFPVPDGVSTGQAASFYLADHEQELWRRSLAAAWARREVGRLGSSA
ncbi:hypothetical protein [Amycolatopsis eburnea]|uniref:hypothetical protein n=1 Tax=Amycolatopsis eburnea TaxID=2267691 RepID=UPI00131576AD|nr:hypothetical protein [Amycolatopsis eburnea]